MTKLGSQKLQICPKVTKMGSIIGHRIDYNGVGALRVQRHIPSKNLPKYPDPELSTPTESRHTTCLQGGKSPSVKLMSRRENKKIGQNQPNNMDRTMQELQ